MFEKMLNWKLLSQSHEFPGPDGGTCVNEAAIVAAGFKYRAVQDVNDLPECFSRSISAYLLRLNDAMPDDLRQRLLLPFVTKLAGLGNNHHDEIARQRLIVLRTVREILPVYLRVCDYPVHASRCEGATGLEAAEAAVALARLDANTRAIANHCYSAISLTLKNDCNSVNSVLTKNMAWIAKYVYKVVRQETEQDPYFIYETAAKIAAEAITIGKQPTLDEAVAIERLNKAREMAGATV